MPRAEARDLHRPCRARLTDAPSARPYVGATVPCKPMGSRTCERIECTRRVSCAASGKPLFAWVPGSACTSSLLLFVVSPPEHCSKHRIVESWTSPRQRNKPGGT
eukprot:360465-Chlamydomonas_euryale.AAC.16